MGTEQPRWYIELELAAKAAYETFMTDMTTGRVHHKWEDLSDDSQKLWRRLVSNAKRAAKWS